MGNARKQLFFGMAAYQTIACSKFCNSHKPHTWKYVLLSCTHHHLHAFRTKRHNKAVWELRKLQVVSSNKSRSFILMNASTYNNNPQENTVPHWLLSCTCNQRCHCNARFKPDILCIRGLPYQSNPPLNPDNNLTIQFIKFTYYNDRFSPKTIDIKIEKYQPLIESITNRGWKVETLIVIIAGEPRAFTYISSMKIIKEKFEIPKKSIEKTFKEINIIVVYHAMSIILHKRRIENNQPIPINQP